MANFHFNQSNILDFLELFMPLLIKLHKSTGLFTCMFLFQEL